MTDKFSKRLEFMSFMNILKDNSKRITYINSATINEEKVKLSLFTFHKKRVVRRWLRIKFKTKSVFLNYIN